MANLSALLYLISAFGFILAIRGLSSAKTAQAGLKFGIGAMALAIAITLFNPSVIHYGWLLIAIVFGGAIGTIIAKKIVMTALPQLIAAFHSLVGLAAVFVAASALISPQAFGISTAESIFTSSLIEMAVGVAVGAFTFTGSVVAFGKLQGLIPSQFSINRNISLFLSIFLMISGILFVTSGGSIFFFVSLILASFALGSLLILPIGGADMPVVISLLNSYSGWAAAGIGFTLGNHLLLITGALVGASGAILSYIMCKGMNRSIVNVLLGGFGTNYAVSANSELSDKQVKISHSEEASYLLKNTQNVIIVPGYGMAVAQAQHALSDIAKSLKKLGIGVRYAIHPVAGRMPGHMNVLLAEANVPYEDVFELEDINNDFPTTDAVIVVGANDITNPAAKTDPQSPIYGMPVLDVEKAKMVFFVKRSLASGYAGIDNDLFYNNNTFMVLGDAKKVCEEVARHLQDN